jgi:hypothetical protein
LPGWVEAFVVQDLQLLGNRVEPFLDLGRLQYLLHPLVVKHALLEHCDFPRFQTLYQKAKLFLPSNGRRERLLNLL